MLRRGVPANTAFGLWRPADGVTVFGLGPEQAERILRWSRQAAERRRSWGEHVPEPGLGRPPLDEPVSGSGLERVTESHPVRAAVAAAVAGRSDDLRAEQLVVVGDHPAEVALVLVAPPLQQLP